MRKTIFWIFLLSAFSVHAQDTTGPMTPKGGQVAQRFVGHIPVFEKYDALEPVLNVDNDTAYIINFWATWCAPCIKEMPYFEQLHRAYQGQKVKVILVSLDFSRQLESKLLPFVTGRNLEPEVIALIDHDYNSWIDRVSPEWSGALPVTLIRKGAQRQIVLEEFSSYEELESIVKSFVNL